MRRTAYNALLMTLLAMQAYAAEPRNSWLSPFSTSTGTFSTPLQGVFPAPPPVVLHKELIPKNISIVRCYYQQQIVGPGTTFGFDINGSGFTSEFHKMISINIDEVDVRVKNLRLITTNQIHGEIEVGPEALTAFIYPRIYIRHLPVFTAPEPFGVVRPNEVLYISMLNVDDTGLSGKYRVITNLDDAAFKRFHVMPTTPGLELGNTVADLPFRVDGTMILSERVPTGKYGLVAYLGKREIYREPELVQIVHPNVGVTGLIKDITAPDPFQRPGRSTTLTLTGSSFVPVQATLLKVQIVEQNVTVSSVMFVSQGQMAVSIAIPSEAKPGFLTARVMGSRGKVLLEKKNVIAIVPANWLGFYRVEPEVRPGGTSQLKIIGRDFTDEFINSLEIQMEEAGIHVGPLKKIDANVLSASLQVDPTVASGDYLVTLTSYGKPMTPVGSRIIKVTP